MMVQMASAPTMTLATTMMAIMAVLPNPDLVDDCPFEPEAAETLAVPAEAVLAVVRTSEAAGAKVSWVGVTVERMMLVVGTMVDVLVEVVAKTWRGVEEMVGTIELVLKTELDDGSSSKGVVTAAVEVKVADEAPRTSRPDQHVTLEPTCDPNLVVVNLQTSSVSRAELVAITAVEEACSPPATALVVPSATT